MNVLDLYKDNKINESEYMSYLLFNDYDLGHNFLKKQFEGVNMEEPPSLEHPAAFAWADGRRSVWRDIKNKIARVQFLLENTEDKDV
jgi:hypothetical protein